jgi:hypothetical protein
VWCGVAANDGSGSANRDTDCAGSRVKRMICWLPKTAQRQRCIEISSSTPSNNTLWTVKQLVITKELLHQCIEFLDLGGVRPNAPESCRVLRCPPEVDRSTTAMVPSFGRRASDWRQHSRSGALSKSVPSRSNTPLICPRRHSAANKGSLLRVAIM